MPVKPGPVGILPVPLPLPLDEPLLKILQAAFFIALLLAAAVVDLKTRAIPDGLCLAVAFTALPGITPLRLLGVLAALPLLLAACCGERQGIGGGDIKLTAAAGLALGFSRGVLGVLLGITAILLFYAAWRLARLARRRRPTAMSKTALPMAPFLALGFIIVYFLRRNPL